MARASAAVVPGTRDLLPPEVMRRNRVMRIMRGAFERFGYSPIETPVVCPAGALAGRYGEEGDGQIYAFRARDGAEMALPYELTVPFARFVAMNSADLPIPFKRYQMQKVWRHAEGDAGGLREPFQCDVDIIGSRSLLCEAEIAELIAAVFNDLGMPRITIKVNSRWLINRILSAYGLEEGMAPAIRAMDSASSNGAGALAEALGARGVRDAAAMVEELRPEGSSEETLRKLEKYDVSRLREFLGYCAKLNLPNAAVQVDPLLATHLDYYTGIVFEAVLEDAPDAGALCVGGRYDGLCDYFEGPDFSGVGVGFEFERMMGAVDRLGLFQKQKSLSQALVTVHDAEAVDDALEVYRVLIEARIASELYLGEGDLEEQRRFAARKGVPFVIVRTPADRESGEVAVERTESGMLKRLSINQLASYLGNYYEAH